MARPPKPGPCLDFGYQYALIRNNRSTKIGVGLAVAFLTIIHVPMRFDIVFGKIIVTRKTDLVVRVREESGQSFPFKNFRTQFLFM